MNYSDEIIEIYGVHYALVSLGFSLDDIYVKRSPIANSPSNQTEASVQLICQDKEFVISLFDIVEEEHVKRLTAEWEKFSSEISTAPPEELRRLYDKSSFSDDKKFCQLGEALIRKGFVLPRLLS